MSGYLIPPTIGAESIAVWFVFREVGALQVVGSSSLENISLADATYLWTNSGLEIVASWIKGTLGRLFGKKAMLLILVKVYRNIYPGNMIQQIILLKIEKTS